MLRQHMNNMVDKKHPAYDAEHSNATRFALSVANELDEKFKDSWLLSIDYHSTGSWTYHTSTKLTLNHKSNNGAMVTVSISTNDSGPSFECSTIKLEFKHPSIEVPRYGCNPALIHPRASSRYHNAFLTITYNRASQYWKTFEKMLLTPIPGSLDNIPMWFEKYVEEYDHYIHITKKRRETIQSNFDTWVALCKAHNTEGLNVNMLSLELSKSLKLTMTYNYSTTAMKAAFEGTASAVAKQVGLLAKSITKAKDTDAVKKILAVVDNGDEYFTSTVDLATVSE